MSYITTTLNQTEVLLMETSYLCLNVFQYCLLRISKLFTTENGEYNQT